MNRELHDLIVTMVTSMMGSQKLNSAIRGSHDLTMMIVMPMNILLIFKKNKNHLMFHSLPYKPYVPFPQGFVKAKLDK